MKRKTIGRGSVAARYKNPLLYTDVLKHIYAALLLTVDKDARTLFYY
jgi:hypothetical protein